MTYYSDLNLNIKKTFWVCPPFQTTIGLCKVVADYCHPKKTVLDMGTGTGIIALYLSKLGCEVTATDISKEALKLAEENSQLNNTQITLIQSDLYTNIQDNDFHLIIFAMPQFFSKSNYYGFISYVYNKIIPSKFDFYFIKFLNKTHFVTRIQKKRQDRILEFLQETPKYLIDNGLVFIVIFKEDINLLKKIRNIKIIKKMRFIYFPNVFIVIYRYKNE